MKWVAPPCPLLSRPGISMRSVTPIKTGIKRYKIHGDTFSFHHIQSSPIQFWIAFQVQYRMIFEVFIQNIGPLNKLSLLLLWRCRLKQIISYCIFLLGFVIWCVKKEKYYSECAMCNYYTPLTINYRSAEIVLSRHTDYVSRSFFTKTENAKRGTFFWIIQLKLRAWCFTTTSILKIYGKIPLD